MNYKQEQHSIIMLELHFRAAAAALVPSVSPVFYLLLGYLTGKCSGMAAVLAFGIHLTASAIHISLSFAVSFFLSLSSDLPPLSRLPVKHNFRYIYFMFVVKVAVVLNFFLFASVFGDALHQPFSASSAQIFYTPRKLWCMK